MIEEEWRIISSAPEYEVSNYGGVRNRTTGRILTPSVHSGNGYCRYSLPTVYGFTKTYYAHRLVAAAFFPNYERGLQITHIDGDPTNNEVSNLKYRNKRSAFNIYSAVIPPKDRKVRIRETGEVFMSVRQCAKYIGGDYSTIYRVLRGERASHKGYTFEYYEEGLSDY